MKHRVFSGVVLVTVLAVASVALAGDYHSGTTLKCSDCHVMHFSQSHVDDDGINPGVGSGPNDYLLRDEPSALCLTCHDGQSWAPDVLGDNTNGYVRQAGALHMLGGTDGRADGDGHTLGYSGNVPGTTDVIDPTHPLTCYNCHAVHGSGSPLFGAGYRNLGGYGTGLSGTLAQVSYTSETVTSPNPLTAWVHQDVHTSVSGSGYTLAQHYGQDAIIFNEPGGAQSYGQFCAGCHGDFHGDAGDWTNISSGGAGGPFIRHPVADVDIGGLGPGGGSQLAELTAAGTNQVQVMSPTGQRAGAYDGTDTGLTPSCMSCHKAHGNANAFGLIYMIGVANNGGVANPITEEGDGGVYKDMCKQCHVQG